MIYIATVHYKSDKWINIQNNHFDQYLQSEFEIFAFLDDIDPKYHDKYSYVTSDLKLSHAEKLNKLAAQISLKSKDPNDIIFFIDGDAFPITNITTQVSQLLEEFPLLAIRRIIEDGDIQPHPSFCATTVGFWKKIGGDWREGYQWKNKRNELTSDVGGNLLGLLNAHDIQWHPLDRSNKVNLHPILYGVYGNMIYHHGAGFREPIFRLSELSGPPIKGAFQNILLKNTTKSFRNIFPKKIRDMLKSVPKVEQSDKDTSQYIYNCIKREPSFIEKYFMNKKTSH